MINQSIEHRPVQYFHLPWLPAAYMLVSQAWRILC